MAGFLAVLLGVVMTKRFTDKQKKTISEFLKFMVVGIINFLVDFGVFKLLSSAVGLPIALSNVFSYTCGVINSFIINRYWTFKIKHKFISVHFAKFVFVNLISLAVNTLAVWVLVDLYGFTNGLFGIENMYAKLIATVFSFTVNFAGNKLLVFKNDKREQDSTEEIL